MLRQPNHAYTIIKEGTAADRADIVACRDKTEGGKAGKQPDGRPLIRQAASFLMDCLENFL